jgi:hypothetical protein
MTTLSQRAHTLLDQAISFGWHTEAMACDYAEHALQAEVHGPENAADAVARAWQERQDDGA